MPTDADLRPTLLSGLAWPGLCPSSIEHRICTLHLYETCKVNYSLVGYICDTDKNGGAKIIFALLLPEDSLIDSLAYDGRRR